MNGGRERDRKQSAHCFEDKRLHFIHCVPDGEIFILSDRKLHNDELHDLYYYSPNIVRVIKSRRMRWAGHVARMTEGRGVYRVLVGRSERKRPLERPRRS
jgi:hypothetical protein